MKMKKYCSFDEYFADQSPKNRSIIRTLRRFVKRVAPGLQESVKWGNGCWVMGSVPVAYVVPIRKQSREVIFPDSSRNSKTPSIPLRCDRPSTCSHGCGLNCPLGRFQLNRLTERNRYWFRKRELKLRNEPSYLT